MRPQRGPVILGTVLRTCIFFGLAWILPALVYGATFSLLTTDVGTSAKSIGIANITGFEQSASAIFENSASLYGIKTASFAAFQTDFLLGESKFTCYSAAMRLGPGVLAAGVMDNRVAGIKNTAADGNNEYLSVGTFDFQNAIYKVAYQFDLYQSQ